MRSIAIVPTENAQTQSNHMTSTDLRAGKKTKNPSDCKYANIFRPLNIIKVAESGISTDFFFHFPSKVFGTRRD